MSEQALLGCLHQLLDSDPSTRHAGEAQLSAASAQAGYGVALSRISLHAGLPFGIRQLAAVVLKQYVRIHWDRSSSKFQEPQTNEEDKAAIRAALPAGLQDDLPKIRTAIGMAIASIAKCDWPEHWPELLPGLVNMLRMRTSPNAVHGAVRCLSLFAGDIEERALPELLPVLLPDLLSIIQNTEQYGNGVQRRALRVLHCCIANLSDMEMELAAATRNVMLPLLPPWFEQFACLMSRPMSGEDSEDWGTRMEVLKILVTSITCFGKGIAAYVPAVLAPCWAMFVQCLPIYESKVVSEDGDIDDGELDSDGENLDFETLISQLFELLLVLVGNNRYAPIMAGSAGQLIYLTMAYMQMTREQSHTWALDPNQYVADEEDETFSVRVTGEMLLCEMLEQFGGNAVAALSQAVQGRLQEAEAARAAGNPIWWRIRESTLLAIGSMAETLEELADGGSNAETFDFLGLLENVRIQDLSSTGSGNNCPFLVGRALWLVARLKDHFPSGGEVAGQLLQAAVVGLLPSSPPPVQIGACRAVAALCQGVAGTHHLRAAAPQLYQGIVVLLQRSGEETLHLVLEALLEVIKADASTAAAYEPMLREVLIKVWGSYANDPLISMDAFDVIAALAAIPECQQGMVSQLAPPLCSLVDAAAAGNGGMATSAGLAGSQVEGALDILALLLKRVPPQAAVHLHAIAMGPVMRLMSTARDSGQLQSGTEVLRLFLKAGGEPMLSWNGADPDATLQAILQVLASLLKPESGESAALNVGGLVTQMLQSVPGRVAAVLPLLLEAILAKLHATNNSPVITGLLLVFCRLIHSSPKDLLDFLSSRPSPAPEQAGQPALAFVMGVWIERQNEFRGHLSIKLSHTALALLLESGHPVLQAVQVKGRRKDTDGAIRTRSRARQQAEQWTTVPLAVKLVEMLSDALIEAEEQKGASGPAAEDDDEDEDADSDSDDFRNFQKGLGVDLFDLANHAAQDDSLFDDEEAKADPVYSIDLVAFIAERLKGALSSSAALRDAAGQHLTAMQQASVHRAIAGK